jgi:hypothetical protein
LSIKPIGYNLCQQSDMRTRIAVTLCILIFSLGVLMFVIEALKPYTPDPIVMIRVLVLAIFVSATLRMFGNRPPDMSISRRAPLVFLGIKCP